MTKARYTNKVLIQNGKIRRSIPIGLEYAAEDQAEAIKTIKPILHAWLRKQVAIGKLLADIEANISCRYLETSSGLTVEFKVQSVMPVE